ncbi:piRNA biogenesis protein EXD1-like [Pelodytes ibericus]
MSTVKDLRSDRPVPGIQIFHYLNIKEVEVLPEAEQEATSGRVEMATEVPGTDTQTHDETWVAAIVQQEVDAATMQDINNAVGQEEVQYTIIDQFQKKFGPAIQHIQGQNVLSVSAAGFNICRNGKLCWLQMASSSHIYLFDICLMGSKVFKNGLKMVLEDNEILKVIHDCRNLSDCLSHQYGTVLSNVFDTQVADVFLFYLDTGGFFPHCTSSVEKCLIKYMNMKPSQVSFLACKEKLTKEVPGTWFKRPMPKPILKLLALEVLHVYPMHQIMLNGMMADFTSSVERYLSVHQRRSADPLMFLGSELPEELHVLQKVRREKALKQYELNTAGLMKPLKEKQVSEEESCQNQQKELSFPNPLHPSERNGLSGLYALSRPLAKTSQREKSWLSAPNKDKTGGKKFEFMSPHSFTSSGTWTRFPSHTSQIPQFRNLEPPTLGLRNLQSPMKSKVRTLPFSCPMGTQIRMAAPQFLAKTFYPSTS